MDGRRLLYASGPVLAAAGLGAVGSRHASETYRRLRKPSWAPPAGAFGPAWSGLYVAIGIAGWRLSASASRPTKWLHISQLAINGAWPIVFFGSRDKRTSVILIALLDGTLAAEILLLRREDPIGRFCSRLISHGADSLPRSISPSATRVSLAASAPVR